MIMKMICIKWCSKECLLLNGDVMTKMIFIRSLWTRVYRQIRNEVIMDSLSQFVFDIQQYLYISFIRNDYW